MTSQASLENIKDLGSSMNGADTRRKRHKSASDARGRNGYGRKLRQRSGDTSSKMKELLNDSVFGNDFKLIEEINASSTTTNGRGREVESGEGFVRPRDRTNTCPPDLASVARKVQETVMERPERGDLSPVGSPDQEEKQFPTTESAHAPDSLDLSGKSPTNEAKWTPVTENDPLGLFSEDAPVQTTASSTSVTSPTTNVDFLLSLDSNEGGPGTATSTPAAASSVKKNLLIDLEPFSDPIFHSKSGSTRTSPSNRFIKSPASSPLHVKTPGSGVEGSVSPGSLGSPSSVEEEQGSPEAWSPLALTSPEASQRTMSLDRGTPTSPKSLKAKMGLITSDSIGNRFKSAATIFVTKFSEMKQTLSPLATPLTTPNKASSSVGSNTSLPKAHEMEKMLYEEDDDSIPPRSGSLDYLSHSASFTDGPTLDDYLDGAKHSRPQPRQTPFGK